MKSLVRTAGCCLRVAIKMVRPKELRQTSSRVVLLGYEIVERQKGLLRRKATAAKLAPIVDYSSLV